MLKFYRSMTLLNTMDRILYESQRQVRGLGLGRGLPEVSLPVFEPEGSSQGGWGGDGNPLSWGPQSSWGSLDTVEEE